MVDNNRPPAWYLRNMQACTIPDAGEPATFPFCRLTRRGAHSAGASFAANPLYFDPKNIDENWRSKPAVTAWRRPPRRAGLGVAPLRFHRIPFLVKLNHNETLGTPNTTRPSTPALSRRFNMGAVAVERRSISARGTIASIQIEEISAAFERAHELGLVTVLWAYLRNSAFKKDGVDYHVSADLTGQANHLAATIGADIVKQKMAENNGGYKAVNFGYTDDRVYSKLTSDNPIDLVRYQLANCYMGRAGLINSGGAAGGETDLADAVRTAVINKRAGGMGLILGRKAFKKSMADGVKLINAVQDVYLDGKVTIA
ncbi:class I fructose-bisphosphate aldolase [Klebsiella pneumoniae]|nr:class I fructose-bisphosphate aldolase [Klebsiella pneumoniae]